MPPPAMGLFKTWIPFGVNNEAVCTLIEHQGSPLRGRIIQARIEKKLRARLFIPVEVPDYRNSTCEDRVAPSSKIKERGLLGLGGTAIEVVGIL